MFKLGNTKLAVTALLLLGGLVHVQESKPLSLKTRIELPNVNGRIDHFSADAKVNDYSWPLSEITRSK